MNSMNSANQSETQTEAEKRFVLVLQQLKLVADNEVLFASTSLLKNTLHDIFYNFNKLFESTSQTIETNITRREQIAEILAACQTTTSDEYYSNTRHELRDLKELSCSESTLRLAQQLLGDADLIQSKRNTNVVILKQLLSLDLEFHGFYREKQCQQSETTRSGLADATIQRLKLILKFLDSDYIPHDYFSLVVPILETHCNRNGLYLEYARPISAELPIDFQVRIALASTLLQITPCDYAKPLTIINKLIAELERRHEHIQLAIRRNSLGYTEEEYYRTEKPTLLLTRLLLFKQAATIHFANNDTAKAEQAWTKALKDYEGLEELAAAGHPAELPTDAIKEIKDYFQAKNAANAPE